MGFMVYDLFLIFMSSSAHFGERVLKKSISSSSCPAFISHKKSYKIIIFYLISLKNYFFLPDFFGLNITGNNAIIKITYK